MHNEHLAQKLGKSDILCMARTPKTSSGSSRRTILPIRSYPTFLRAWREYQKPKLTQGDVGKHVGMTHSQVGRIENGLNPYTKRLLEGLASLCGCHPADLLWRDPRDPEEIWPIWRDLTADEKKQALDHLRAMIRHRRSDAADS